MKEVLELIFQLLDQHSDRHLNQEYFIDFLKEKLG